MKFKQFKARVGLERIVFNGNTYTTLTRLNDEEVVFEVPEEVYEVLEGIEDLKGEKINTKLMRETLKQELLEQEAAKKKAVLDAQKADKKWFEFWKSK